MFGLQDALHSLWPEDVPVRILGGPARGLRWYPKASEVTSYWRGTYERAEVARFRELLRPSTVVYDIGAHLGYYALVAARCIGPSGHVYAFEPTPESFRCLVRHARVNCLTNIDCRNEALLDQEAMLPFRLKRAPMENGLVSADPDAVGELIPVSVRSIDHLTGRSEIRLPALMKVDVEGVEAAVLRGGEKTIRTSRPTIFLSVHSPSSRTACIRLLQDWNYEISVLDGLSLETSYELLAVPKNSRDE